MFAHCLFLFSTKVCRALLFAQPTLVLLDSLGDVLLTLSTSFANIDTRDHGDSFC
jgi:hypothetical protein